jgi:RNA polymerase sigma factor (sigma-70 family)
MVEVGDGDHGTDLGRVASRPDQRADERDELVRLLRTLTDRERRVVVLRHYFDLSEREVAEELAIAPGTVKSTLARALSKLRVSTNSIQEVVGK